MDPDKLRKWREEAIEAFEEVKRHIIAKGGKNMTEHIFSEMLRLDFPTDPDNLQNLREEDLGKAIFLAHAKGVESVTKTIIQMIQDGLLVPDGDRAAEVARKIREEEKNSGPWRFKMPPILADDDEDSGFFTLESGSLENLEDGEDSSIFTLELEEDDLEDGTDEEDWKEKQQEDEDED